jgi:signal transduction histidine kinase
LAAAPIRYSDGTDGVAVVTLARADAFAARTGVFRALLVSGAIAIALAILAGLGLGAWMARPLRRLSASARRMAGGSYEQPVTGSYPGEIQELATSMETMRKEVRRSEESLRGFVATAAHELRTPLTSIQGFSQALLDGTAATSQQQQRSAAAIFRESTRLRRLVEALLTLSRYDSHEFEPTVTRVAVDVLVGEEVERLVQVGLAEPGRIAVQVDSDAHVVTDGDMLRQVIANLLSNAVQYGGADPVAVWVGANEKELILEVGNGGEPLTPEDRARIFDRFYRGSAGRRTDGLGLGLALVWEICDVLGGRVELVDGGPLTRFRVTLPVTRDEAARSG